MNASATHIYIIVKHHQRVLTLLIDLDRVSVPAQVAKIVYYTAVSWTTPKLFEAFGTLLQACDAPLHLQQLLFSVAAQALDNLIQETDYGLHHLDPGLGMPQSPVLLLQRHASGVWAGTLPGFSSHLRRKVQSFSFFSFHVSGVEKCWHQTALAVKSPTCLLAPTHVAEWLTWLDAGSQVW